MGSVHFTKLGFLLLSCYCLLSSAIEVTYDSRSLMFDGQRKIIISGAIHYPRSTPEMWPDLIQKAKEGGLDTIETYVFWNGHEPLYRQYNFKGRYDIIRYIKTIQAAGMYAILRIGPYVCAEWNYGGFPVWLHNLPNITLRTDNEVYKNEMKIFTTKIVDMVKQEQLFASQGGPIILAQIENEYGNVMSPYGEAGKSYIKWCADLAVSLNIGVPWIMCQQPDAPPPMISTCNGFYCDQFKPTQNTPKMWTENWSGWYNDWGQTKPYRTAEDLAFAVARFYQTLGTLQNYYMYHGGTNFERTAGGPYITTSYDYNAPLDEYGNLNQPKWGHLRELHLILKANEKILTNGLVENFNYNDLVVGTVFELLDRQRICFIGNSQTDKAMTVELLKKNFTVPPWSVTILQDCTKEIYNTAQVNVQTSVMEMNPSTSSKLKWSYKFDKPEFFKDPTAKFFGKDGQFLTNSCPDQKKANDTSDYVWYMTSIDVQANDPIWSGDCYLHVQTDGPVLHVFVNNQHIGTHWGKNGKYSFEVEQLIQLQPGRRNYISLLSVSVGFQNYGAFFDEGSNGILGPVYLITPNNHMNNITLNEWEIRSGLDGLVHKWDFGGNDRRHPWRSNKLPINKEFVWYKTTFDAPIGSEPVVIDLFDMGKGSAWVNGHNIGRYWPSNYADANGCNPTCDYKGAYNGGKCTWNCGNPTQRLYHVPRSFLREESNTLVLFEEFGGNPSNVSVQTVTTGQICADVVEGSILELSCVQQKQTYGRGSRKYHAFGESISNVTFASFGDATGSCGLFGAPFKSGSCESPNTLAVIKEACEGRESCTIDVSEASFGTSSCMSSVKKRLVVSALC